MHKSSFVKGVSAVLLAVLTTSANAGSLIDPCVMVDRGQAAALIGGDYSAKDRTVLTANNDGLYDRSGDCTLAAATGTKKVFYTVFVAKDAAFAAGNFAQSQKAVDDGKVMAGVKTSPVPGVGDRAYSYHYAYGPGYSSQDTTVSVVAGKKLVTVSLRNFSGSESNQVDQAKGLAAHLLGKL